MKNINRGVRFFANSFSYGFLTVVIITSSVFGQQSGSSSQPVIIQPGAPGEPSKILPSDTRAKLPPLSKKDVEFMRGMIMHHAQAVEMTAMIAPRTKNKELTKLGAKISQSQAEEINFMKRWLILRGEKTEMPAMGMAEMNGMENHMHHHQHSLMPGMLTEKQMEALRVSKGAKFDKLFLEGMIQHHIGALVMVKDLFETAGAAQDAELFNFASDVDSGQRAEIKIMETLLDKKSKEGKQ